MIHTLLRTCLVGLLALSGWASAYAAPSISSVSVLDGELREESRLLIRGAEFGTEKNGISVRIGNYSASVEQVAPMEVWVQLPKNVQSGDITVTVNRETSKGYYFDIPRPVVHYVYRDGGLLPGTTVEIGGERILRTGSTTEVLFEGKPLDIRERDFANQRIQVALPHGALNGSLIVQSNGFASQPVRLDIVQPFYITGVSTGAERTIEVRGVFPEGTASVYIDNTSLKVRHQYSDRIVAELPSGNVPVSGGLVTVRYGNRKSIGVPLSLDKAPTIYEIGDIKRIVQNHVNAESTVYYEIEVLMFGEANGTEVYMNGRQMPISRRLPSAVYLKTEEFKVSDTRRAPFAITGTMYAVKNGNKGTEYTYDLSDRMAPVLYRVEAPEGFGPRKKLILWGVRLGDRPSEMIVNSSVGVQQNEETKEQIIMSHSAMRIEFRLPDTTASSGTVSVTVRGMRSNEITFPMEGTMKEVGRNPQLTSISYPKGHTAGSEILISGSGFSDVKDRNSVWFGTTKATPERMNGEEGMYVKIPAGMKSGNVTVEVTGRKSNALPVTVVSEARDGLEFFFEEPTLLRVDSDGSRATSLVGFGVRNMYRKAVLSKVRFDIEFTDAAEKTNPYAVAQTGLLPIDRIDLVYGGKTYSSIVRRTGTHYYVEFSGIEVPVLEEKQVMQLHVLFTPYVASGSEITFVFDGLDGTYVAGSFPDTKETYEAKLSTKRARVKSTPIRVFSPRHDCVEVDSRGAYCVARMAVVRGVEAEATKEEVKPVETPKTEQRTPTVIEEERKAEITIPLEKTPTETEQGTGRSLASLLPFRDADGVTWAQDALYTLSQKNIISGYTVDGQLYFRPDQQVTRAELIKMMLEARNMPVEETTDTWPFTDVRGDAWYVPYIGYAKEKGMIQGYTDGNFRPNAPVTRAEAVKIILSVAQEDLRGVSVDPKAFRDVDGWALPWVQKAVAMKLVNGYADGTFRSDHPLNRVEAAQMVYLFLSQ